MIKVLTFVFALLLAGCCACVPAISPDALTAERSGEIVTLWARLGPELNLSSTEPITSFSPADACEFQTILAGENLSLVCKAPVTVRLETKGTVAAAIYSGYTPLTQPIVIPRNQ